MDIRSRLSFLLLCVLLAPDLVLEVYLRLAGQELSRIVVWELSHPREFLVAFVAHTTLWFGIAIQFGRRSSWREVLPFVLIVGGVVSLLRFSLFRLGLDAPLEPSMNDASVRRLARIEVQLCRFLREPENRGERFQITRPRWDAWSRPFRVEVGWGDGSYRIYVESLPFDSNAPPLEARGTVEDCDVLLRSPQVEKGRWEGIVPAR